MAVRRIRIVNGERVVTESGPSTAVATDGTPTLDDENRDATELEMAFGEALAAAFIHGGRDIAREWRARLND